jgi:FAD/FMN-containing dehydrogenase/Fe-S oxidoreductase
MGAAIPASPNPDLIRDLRKALRGDVHADRVRRGIFATDASIYQQIPVAVAVPRDTDDIAAALEVARAHRVPVLGRGGGTSLAGQTTTTGIVLDLTKHFAGIVGIDAGRRRARVQPGVVRDTLNAALAPHGLMFAPETSTSNRAVIGGMLGNNSSGMMSIRYGRTSEHIASVEALLADGTRETFGTGPARTPRGATLRAQVADLLGRHRAQIEARWPRVLRRVGGYSFDEVLRAEPHWGRFLAGSEGTLALFTEIEVELVEPPRAVALMAVHFRDLITSLRAVPAMVAHAPLSIELMDGTLIRMSRGNPTTAPLCGFIHGEPGCVLAVEATGDSPQEARAALRRIEESIPAGAAYHIHHCATDAERLAVHEVRKLGLGVMTNMAGDAKPISFIEDACVPVESLADYIEELEALCRAEGARTMVYGHASVGVLHFKPVLNLKDPADVARMERISAATVDLVRRHRGSWSGEHGDGIIRGAMNERFWGPEITGLFRTVKNLFDPLGILNPGKIVDTPPLTENLRSGPGSRAGWGASHYHFRAEGGFQGAVEMCNGVGACRKTGSGTMCPSFMATRNEQDTVRGRANALRLAITGHLGPAALADSELHEVLDLCLSCKACKTECPQHVDMAKMKGEALAARHGIEGVPPGDRLVAAMPALARLAAGPLAPFANALADTDLARWALHRFAGFARDARLPALASRRFSAWFRRRARRPDDGPVVALFVDTYTECYEPRVGIAAVRVLERAGYRVVLAEAGCCQRPALSKGLLDEARTAGTRTLRALDRLARRGIPIVALEPSCLSALRDDLPDLCRDAALGARTATHAVSLEALLARDLPRVRGRLAAEAPRPVVLHGHCHQKALEGTAPPKRVLAAMGAPVREIPSGCCGMAGSFGYEARHADLSRRIAEDRLLPAVRALRRDDLLVADGFSCRHQIASLSGEQALHFAEALDVLLHGTTHE